MQTLLIGCEKVPVFSEGGEHLAGMGATFCLYDYLSQDQAVSNTGVKIPFWMCLFLSQIRLSHSKIFSLERVIRRELSTLGKEIVTHRQEVHSAKSSK